MCEPGSLSKNKQVSIIAGCVKAIKYSWFVKL